MCLAVVVVLVGKTSHYNFLINIMFTIFFFPSGTFFFHFESFIHLIGLEHQLDK